MKCAICNKDQSGKIHKLNISGQKYEVFICDQCETEKGKTYDAFFDNVRKNIEADKNK